MTPQHVAHKNGTKITADLLNEHLLAGGELRVLSAYKATYFKKRSAGCFFTSTNGETWYGKGLKVASRWIVANKDGKLLCNLQFGSPAK